MPFDPDSLPELSGDLQEPNSRNIFADLWKMRKGNLGPFDYEMKKNGINLQAEYENALAKAFFNKNGNWNAEVNTPMFGGDLGFRAQDQNGNRNYYLQFNKQF